VEDHPAARGAIQMTGKKSLLEDLYTDSGGFDEDRAVAVLKKVLSIQRGTHTVIFHRNTPLKEADKVLAFMLMKKLLKSDGAVESSAVSGKQIKAETDVKPGTVDFTIKTLKEEGVISGSGSNYELVTREIDGIVDRLEKRAGKG
jgi:hypothetical protein